ncbi:MAG TPA: FliA/WhiG family RNA polymerase sigma factor [bacterium]|nr:FliA/WhiG family RNA polymerase sigma factor [bacterium]
MENIDELWARYKKDKNEADREKIIKNYLPLVKYLTDRISQHLPQEVRSNDSADLYIEGVIGLMEAVERFNLSRRIKFETFASKRIRGAVIDALRKEDFLPKNLRDEAKRIEQAYLNVESRLGRKASDDEISAELKMTKDEFYGILKRLNGITLMSLNAEVFNRDGELFRIEDIIGDSGSAAAEAERKDVLNALAAVIETLDREERIVLETYYWDGLTLKEIGKVMGLSESRVCQLHTAVILKLRGRLSKLEKER